MLVTERLLFKIRERVLFDHYRYMTIPRLILKGEQREFFIFESRDEAVIFAEKKHTKFLSTMIQPIVLAEDGENFETMYGVEIRQRQ